MRDKHKCCSELPSIPAIPSHQHQTHTHSQHAVNDQDLLNAPGSEWLGARVLPVSSHPGENLLVCLQPNSTSWFSTKRSISIDKEPLTVLRPNGLPLLPLSQWEWEYWQVKMYPLAKITPHKVKKKHDKVSLERKRTDNINPGKRGYSDLAFVSGNKHW